MSSEAINSLDDLRRRRGQIIDLARRHRTRRIENYSGAGQAAFMRSDAELRV